MTTRNQAARLSVGLPLYFGLLVVTGCSSTVNIASTSPHEAIVVDGRLNDWIGARTLIKDKRISVDVRNDPNFVYFSLATSDRASIRSIMMGGLTVWFDSTGGKKRNFGVRYPLGLSPEGGFPRDRGGFEGGRRPFDQPTDLGDEFEILEEAGYASRYHIGELTNVNVKANIEYGTFSYEVQVPRHRSDEMSSAVGAPSKKGMSVGLETKKLERPQGMEEGGRQGGMGGRMGGPGGTGGRQGGMGGGGFRPESLDEWFRVTLVHP